MEHFDAIIIGFGKGGKLLAADLANRGQQGSHNRTFGCDVRRLLHQYRLYSDQSIDPSGPNDKGTESGFF